jgi:serine protease
MGGIVDIKQIPILKPGQSTIMKFEWYVPNPVDYFFINTDPWHFCLTGRILSEKDPMTVPEIYEFEQNVRNNNNIVWKNLSVVDIEPNTPIGGSVYVNNPYDLAKAYRFKFFTETLLYEQAEIKATLNPTLYNAWVLGGRSGAGIIDTEEANVIRITAANATLENVILNPDQLGIINLTFNFLTEEYTATPQYEYYLEQRSMDDNSLVGGEAYLINTPWRSLFYTDGGGNKEANYNETVLLSASDIGEPAVYNWYDSYGNKVHTGKDYIM